METIENSLLQTKKFILVFVSAILLAFNFYFVYFVNSSYVKNIVGESYVSVLFAVGALINILMFMRAPTILAKYGNYRFALYLAIVDLFVLLGIVFVSNPIISILLVMANIALGPLLFYTLDIFLEKISSVANMGSVRGTYLTMLNIPPAITPVIVGILLANLEYWKAYLMSAIFLIPFLIILIANFKDFEDPYYTTKPFGASLRTFLRDQNLANIVKDNFILHVFYAVMVMYMPIYLNTVIGFDWPEIGTMFSIMLLPFILFQIPLGGIEDRNHDEKQILVAGFLIISISTIIMSFITEKNFMLWTSLLFISRIGASFVEVSCESYFFKHIRSKNASFVSIFRTTRALPYIIIPLFSYLIITFLGISYMFLIVGLILFCGGLRYTFELKQ